MPLVVMCGRPLSGKTVRAYALAALLRAQGHRAVVVSDSALRTGAAEGCEGDGDGPVGLEVDAGHRAELRAGVERALAAPSVVCICDAANEVRGFRYELYCLAKARATPSCTLFCDVAPALSDARNAAAPPAQRLTPPALARLRRRFEEPNAANRWERPLFVCRDGYDDDGDKDNEDEEDEEKETKETKEDKNNSNNSAAAVERFAKALMEAGEEGKERVECAEDVGAALGLPLAAIGAALFEAAAPTPNSATRETRVSTAASVHSLDAATGAVTAALLRAVNDVAFVPGDEVSLAPAAARRLVVARKVGAAELGRLRRQFVRVNEACAARLADPAEAFAAFLQNALA